MNLAQKFITKIEKLNQLYLFTFIFLLGFIVYGGSLSNGFVWDDEEQIVNNAIIKNISNIPYLFTASTFNTGGAGLTGLYYKPLMPVFFSITNFVWGLNPFGFHLFSLILHIFNTLLLYKILKNFFALEKINYSKTIAFGLSVIFLVHPANTESVAYLSSTQELLYTFFLLLSLISAFKFCQKKHSSVLLFLVNFFVFLSLLSKESGAIAIPIIIVFPWLFFKHKTKNFIITLPLTFVVYLFIRFGIAKTPLVQHNSIIPIANASIFERLTTIPYELFSYLRLILFPNDLYVAQHNVIKSVSDPRFYISIIMTFICIIVLIYLTRIFKSKLYLFFLLWILFSFSILLNIYPLDMTIAERWLYAPIIGFMGIIGLLLSKTIQKKGQLLNVILSLFILVIIIFSLRTKTRSDNWNNNLSLFSHDIKYSKDSFDVQNNYGVALFRNGNLKEAKLHFEKSIELSPKWWTPYSNLGVIYQREGNFKKAKELYEMSIKNGGYYLAYENLAIIKLNTEKPEEVLPFIKDALSRLPYNEILNKIAAILYYKDGKIESAKIYANQAYSLNPSQENYNLLQSIINTK